MAASPSGGDERLGEGQCGDGDLIDGDLLEDYGSNWWTRHGSKPYANIQKG